MPPGSSATPEGIATVEWIGSTRIWSTAPVPVVPGSRTVDAVGSTLLVR